MFGDNQSLAQQQAAYSSPMQPAYGIENAAQAQENGIVSTVKELLTVIQENRNIAGNIEDALGISTPSQAGEKSSPDVSLVQVLRAAIGRVCQTNDHLLKVLRHINS